MCVKANIKGISFVHEFSVLYVVYQKDENSVDPDQLADEAI